MTESSKQAFPGRGRFFSIFLTLFGLSVTTFLSSFSFPFPSLLTSPRVSRASFGSSTGGLSSSRTLRARSSREVRAHARACERRAKGGGKKRKRKQKQRCLHSWLFFFLSFFLVTSLSSSISISSSLPPRSLIRAPVFEFP